ncbi:MAG TPA: hypothetical protein VJW96_11875 [Terriglobales bacterium]|nr:hypothetical protein [Terriglobales bacterium]
MPQVLDLIRNSQLPSNLMQSAARGSLSVPPGEMIEILVYLALHHKLFGDQARMTLAGWDEKASLAAAADPNTSAEVLGYFVSLENLRPSLLPSLAGNPSVGEELLDGLAVSGARSVVEILLRSTRVMSSPRLLQALQANACLRPNELAEIAKQLAALQVSSGAEPPAPEADENEEVLEATLTKYLEVNAAELEAEKDKPFQPIGIAHELVSVEAAGEAGPQAAAAAGSASADAAGKSVTVATGKSGTAAAAAIHAKKQTPVGGEGRRDSALQRISKLDIRSRIALAMRGSKEDRSILIRDSTKLVAVAVLDSPKVSETEVEAFATQKNLLDSVLRAIPLKRKFAKNYTIMRNIVYNPRTPIDTSLGLVKGLLIHDLKNLMDNKDVSDTIRKTAVRLYKQRLEKKG